MRQLPFHIFQARSNVSHSRRIFVFWAAVILRRSRRLLPLAVVFSLILQLIPLGLPAPSRVVNNFITNTTALGHRLSVLPAWMNPDSAAVAEALAPVDRLVAGLGPQAAHAKETSPTTLEFTKVCEPNPVNQGDFITYTLYITNTGAVSASIRITDLLPAGTIYQDDDIVDGGGALWVRVWDPDKKQVEFRTNDWYAPNPGSLPIGGEATLQYVVGVTVPFTDQATIANTAVLTANIASMLDSSCNVTVNAPVFEIAKTPRSPVVEAGDPLTYTLYVTNTGHLTATRSFTVTDLIPDDTYYVSSSPAGTYSETARTVTWVLTDDLGIDQGITTTFVVTVATPYTNGAIITNNTYRAWSSEVISAAEGDPVTVTVRSHPTLTLTKTADPDPVQAGSYLVYVLTLANQLGANGHAQNIIVTDTVPVNTVYESCSGAPCLEDDNVITWTLPASYSLLVGASTQFTFTVQVYSPQISGTNIANASYGVTSTNALASVAGDPLTTTINSSPDLTVTKSVEPSSVLAGEIVTYTVVITNKGNETATGVAVTDTLPVSFTFGGMAQGDDPTVAGNVLTWTNQAITGTVVPYKWITSGPLTLIFTVTTGADIPDGTVLPNFVTVTYGLTDVATGPTAPVTITKPQLNIAKSAHSGLVPAGGTLTYTIRYSNTSGTPASSVIITDLLPSHVNFVTATTPFAPPSPSAGDVMTWTIGDLAGNSGSQSITLVLTVTTPLTNGTVLTNEAWIGAAEPSADSTGPVTTVVQSAPDIVLHKYASGSTVSPGGTLTYTLSAVNDGNASATGVVITDVLPDHTYFITASGDFAPTGPIAGDVMTWTLGSLAGEGLQMLTTTLVVTVETPLTNGLEIPNTAWIASAQGASDADTVTVTVSSALTLTLTKEDSPDPVAVGGTLLYTLTVQNLSVSDAMATGIVISDTVPDETEYTAASSNCAETSGLISCTLSNLTPGASDSITFSVQVDSDLADGAELANTASVTCAQNVTATDTETTIVRAPDMQVTKSASPAIVRPGETITYVITFANVGGIAASGVRITDTLPLSASLVTSQTTGASFVPGSTYAWLSPTVEAGSVGTITITAQVTTTPGWIDPNGGTIIENSVVITATTPDGDPSDNQDTTQTTVYAGLPQTLTLTAAPSTLSIDDTATITATVTDQWGNPVMNQDNVTVTLVASLTGSDITPDEITMVLGQATATITSSASGVAFITGTVGAHPTVTDTAQVTFTAGALHHFAFGPIGDQDAGINFSIAITAHDQYNNVVDYDGTVTLQDAGSATLQPTTSDSFSNGLLASQTISITQARANQPIRAISGTVDIYPSNPFTVGAGAPTSMTLTINPDTVAVGDNSALAATVFDQYNNPVPSQVITFESTNLGGGGIVPPTDTTGSDGQATSTISSTLLGVRTVTATTASGISVTAQVTFTVGPPAVITLTIVPDTTPVGNSAQMTATVVDAYSNPVTGWDIEFSTGDDLGTGAINPATDDTDAAGIATSVITSTASGVKTVQARALSTSVSDTAQVTFTAGALDHFAIGPVADPQTAGAPFTLVITAQDQFNNAVVSFTGQVTMTDSTGTLSPLTSGNFGGGARSVAVSITLAQDDVRIAVTNTAGSQIGASNLFDVIANVPAMVTLQADPANVPLQGAASLTTTVTDAWSNLVTNGTVVAFAAEFGAVDPMTDTTISGQAESQLTADCVERSGVVVTATAGTAFTTTTVNFIAPGAPQSITAIAAPTSIPVGTGVAVITATVYDCRPGPVPNQAVSFVTSLGGLSLGSGTTDPNGVVTVTLSGTVAGTAYITATADGIGASTTVIIEPGPPATVTVTANPAIIRANGSATSTITADVTDQYGNAVADGTGVSLEYNPTSLGTLAPLSITTANGSGSAVFTADVITGTVTITAASDGAVGTTLLTLVEGFYYVYLPLVARNYTPPPVYDLVVESVTWIPSPPEAGQTYHVQVVIRNDGTMTVTRDFWVDLYLNPSATPGINQTWNMLSQAGYGKAWLVYDDIAPGQTVTVLTSDPDDPSRPGDRYSYWPPPPFDASHNPFYVLVDSWGQSYGLVDEGAAEDNNLWGPMNASGLGDTGTEGMNRRPGPAAPPRGSRPPLSIEKDD